MGATGGCQCNGVRYQVAGEPLMTYACYCHGCQKRTGSAFSLGAIYPASALQLEGELVPFERRSDDGSSNTRYSCAACGNVIYGVGEATADFIKLQPGTLDDPANVVPDAHIWTGSAQRWIELPDNALTWETQPDNLFDVYTAVLERRDQ